MKPMCPYCGSELEYRTVLKACKTAKINQDGKPSKRAKIIINCEDTDIIFLYCNCGFSYDLTSANKSKEEIQEFENWYKKLLD